MDIVRCLSIEVASKSLLQWIQGTLLFRAGLSGSGGDKKEAGPEDLRLLVELQEAVELAEVELSGPGPLQRPMLP